MKKECLTIRQLAENAAICGLLPEQIRVLTRYYPEITPWLPEYLERYYQAWPEKPAGFDLLFEPEISFLGPERTQALYLTVILAGIQRSEQLYAERGYPHQMWREIMPDLRLQVELTAPDFLRHRSSIWWSYEILSGHTVQLGRLQFQAFKFFGPVRGYRHAATGRITLLAEGGDSFDADGLYAEPGPDTRQTLFCRTDDFVSGNPIRNGRIGVEPVRLRFSDYQPFLDSASDVMIIHIPEGKKLDLAECRDSFRRAVKFYEQYFPHLDMKGFICLSWLLDVQLQEVLPAESNILKFQQTGYLYPLKNAHSEALERVFGTNHISSIKPVNRLRKGIFDLIAAGKKLRDGGIFIPLEANSY